MITYPCSKFSYSWLVNASPEMRRHTQTSVRIAARRPVSWSGHPTHYSNVIMGVMASQITSLTLVYSTVDSGADQRKHKSSASLAFVRGICRWSVNCPHKWPVTRKMFPFDDVIMHSMKGRFMGSMSDYQLILWELEEPYAGSGC